jgi:uncharacterized protein (TIGR02186 family)
MKKLLNLITKYRCASAYVAVAISLLSSPSIANPIISGISSNEINIDTQFNGTKILLFGAKRDAGDIVIAVRGPKKDFIVTKKQKFFGVWYNGKRIKFKDSYSLYSLFSTTNRGNLEENLLSDLEIGKTNLEFEHPSASGRKINDFEVNFIEQLENQGLYSTKPKKVGFLDETLFKVSIDFPKNIARGIYTVEIYLIQGGSLLSFQSIPIYANQVGLSAKILDFANEESFLYGLVAVAIALVIGWIANYLFARFIGK